MSGRRKKKPAAKKDIKRCAIYTRKSTAAGLEQEFNTLHAQREACEQYIASQAHLGWELLQQPYDDGGFTGANLERPGFRRLMADIEAGKIDIVVVYKVDRLSRSLLDFARVMDQFNQSGTAFVSVTQNFSTADAIGRLTLNMLMSFAEFEREMIAERTRDKIAAARRRGKWTGGPVPIGYDVVDRRLVINELEAVVVRELFDLYEQHQSALAVSRLLNENGRATKRHKAANGNIRQAREWTKNSVLRVLRNPIYSGVMPYGDELHDGEHEAIIDRDRYARVRAILDSRNIQKRNHGRNPAYILRGLLRCKLCGGAMTPASTRKQGREYRYYRCVTRDKKGRKACNGRPLPAEELEHFVAERIREATLGGDLANDIAEQLKQRVEARRQALKAERRGLPRMIANLATETNALIEELGDAADPARQAALEAQLDEIRTELDRREIRLAEVNQALAALDEHEVEAQWVLSALADFGAVWSCMTIENRGRLVRAIVEQVEIDEPDGTITVTLANLTPTDGGDQAAEREAAT